MSIITILFFLKIKFKNLIAISIRVRNVSVSHCYKMTSHFKYLISVDEVNIMLVNISGRKCHTWRYFS